MSSRELPSSLPARRPWLLKAALALAAIGLLDTGYLMWGKLTNAQLVCLTGSGCDTVASSPYAYLLGVPLAYLGFGMYAMQMIAAVWLDRKWARQSRAVQAVAATMLAFSFAGALFSTYLTWVSVTLIGATCSWCLISATIAWLMLPCTYLVAQNASA